MWIEWLMTGVGDGLEGPMRRPAKNNTSIGTIVARAWSERRRELTMLAAHHVPGGRCGGWFAANRGATRKQEVVWRSQEGASWPT